MNSRRKFVKQSALARAGITLMPKMSFGITSGKTTEKLRIGMIGVGLRGANHLNNLF